MSFLVLVSEQYMDKDDIESIECSLHSVHKAATRNKPKNDIGIAREKEIKKTFSVELRGNKDKQCNHGCQVREEELTVNTKLRD